MFQFTPIQHWPRALTNNRRAAPFRKGRSDTERLLRFELAKIGASNVAIQVACDDLDFRRDGQLKTSAVLRHPGVIVSFSMKGKPPVSIPCDRFTEWTDNLRAIALSLAALRQVDRYGVTRHGEQYTGWQQLPGPNAEELPFKDADEASKWLVKQAEVTGTAWNPAAILISPRELGAVRIDLAKILHPDRNGSPELFKLMEKAVAMVDAHQKRSG